MAAAVARSLLFPLSRIQHTQEGESDFPRYPSTNLKQHAGYPKGVLTVALRPPSLETLEQPVPAEWVMLERLPIKKRR
jgi:hypothetical protein